MTGIAFDDGTHGTYDVDYPDTIAGLSGGTSCLRYSTTASEAGIQVDTGTYRAVTFGFPFETIWDSSKRTTVMGKVIGFLLPCVAPPQAVALPKATESGASVTLTLTDPNAASSVTGYDVYRSSSPSLAKGSWPAVATNVVDGDGATTGIQWTDSSGAASPTGTWFYDAAAANARCSLEGPR